MIDFCVERNLWRLERILGGKLDANFERTLVVRLFLLYDTKSESHTANTPSTHRNQYARPLQHVFGVEDAKRLQIGLFDVGQLLKDDSCSIGIHLTTPFADVGCWPFLLFASPISKNPNVIV
jgi:hypothetical protein